MSLTDNKVREIPIYWIWKLETGETENEIYLNDLEDSKFIGKIMSMQIAVTGKQVLEKPKYIVAFDVNGGNAMEQSTKQVEAELQLGTLPTPTRTGYAFVGWFTKPEDGSQITENTIMQFNNVTYYAHWNEKHAIFDTGTNVNLKMKNLAGDNTSDVTTQDTKITAIMQSDTEPALENKTADNTVSTSTSSYPIYMWYDNRTIYWWSEDITPELNSDASHMFNNFRRLADVSGLENFDTSNTTTMEAMFYGCTSLTSLELGDKFDTSNVTSMYRMFMGCSSLANLDFGDKFDTSNVTTMRDMFYGCTGLTSLDLGDNFDTSNVTSIRAMFMRCSSLTYLNLGNKFDTSNVTTMQDTFSGCSSISTLDISNFNMNGVTEITNMFNECTSLQELKTPKRYPSNVSVKIVLPITLYDENEIAYTRLDNTSPTQTWLRAE